MGVGTSLSSPLSLSVSICMPSIWQKLFSWLKRTPAASSLPPPQTYTFPLSDFPDGQGTPVTVGGRRLAIFHLGEQVFAVDNVCSHNLSPLAGGLVSGTVVTCRTHRARFSLETGAVLHGPARKPIRTYPVTISEDSIAITVH